MYQYELKDFREANLTFNIPTDSSVITAPLEVEVNDNLVFSRNSVRSTQQVSLSRSEADLRPGYNTIEFKTNADAKYTLENTQLTVRYLGTTQDTNRNISVSINNTQKSYINRENTQEALTFDYQLLSGEKSLKVSLGSYNTTLSPVNGQNHLDIPEGSFENGDNIRFEGSGSFSLNNVRLSSREVEGE